jgi:glycosyltransferase involved in cell wall biosynthesis
MKILYVITKSNWGGAQRNVFDLATQMKASGHEVSVALGGKGVLQKKLESAGIFTHPIDYLERDFSFSKDFKSLREIYSIIKERRPDVIHLHSPKASGLGALAARLLGTKRIITTVHGWTFNEDRKFIQKATIAFFSWLTMVLAHKVILLSDKEYYQALKFPWVRQKLTTIPLGIKTPVFMSIDGAKQFFGKMLNMDINSFGKKIVIGTIAELHRNKALNYLIDAMSIVSSNYPQAICLIVGEGEERANLEKQIKDLKLEDKIFLTGFIDNCSEYLKAFNIFTMSSIKEGLPYTLLEAGSASLPVVSTPVGGIPEIIEDMRSGILIQARNSKELAHGISFLIENPDERRRYGNALKDRVTNVFSIEKMYSSTERLYKNI